MTLKEQRRRNSKRIRDITTREVARHQALYTAVRRDFRTPKQRQLEAVKRGLRTAVYGL